MSHNQSAQLEQWMSSKTFQQLSPKGSLTLEALAREELRSQIVSSHTRRNRTLFEQNSLLLN
jgi:hypothetical protein